MTIKKKKKKKKKKKNSYFCTFVEPEGSLSLSKITKFTMPTIVRSHSETYACSSLRNVLMA